MNLDNEERNILSSYENGDWKSNEELNELKGLEEIAKNQLQKN